MTKVDGTYRDVQPAPRLGRTAERYRRADAVLETELLDAGTYTEDDLAYVDRVERQTGVKMPVLGGGGTMRKAVRHDD